MGRGASARRRILPVAAGTSASVLSEPYLARARAALRRAHYESVCVGSQTERFLLLTMSNAGVRAACHLMLADALAAALPLIHGLDCYARVFDLGDFASSDAPLGIPVEARIRIQRTGDGRQSPSSWRGRLLTITREGHARPRPGSRRTAHSRYLLIIEELDGALVFESFPLLGSACQRIGMLFWTHERFVALWDLAGGDGPLRISFGLQATGRDGIRVSLWDQDARPKRGYVHVL